MTGWFVTSGGPVDPGSPRIFCFPHAGGSPRAFLDWQAGLGADAEIVAVCRPGREHRAAEPAPTIGELIDGAAAAITAVTEQDARPCYLFGHSLGALVAFEVCRRLTTSTTSTTPPALVAPVPAATPTASTAPAPAPAPAPVPASVAPRHLVASGCSAPSLLPSQRVKHIATLTGAEFAEAIGFFGGLAPDVIADAELRDLLLPGLIADFRMAVGYRYRPGPRLAVPATLVVGRDDPHVGHAETAPWDQEFTWPPDRHLLDGAHFYFEPDPAPVIAILRSLVQADQHVELI